jgi:hypothetical protein
MRAPLWGPGIDGKGGGRHQGWENAVYPAYAAAAVILIFGVGFAPDTSIKTWARHEASSRMNLKEAGELDDCEFGTHYGNDVKLFHYEAEDVDKMPRTEYSPHH